MQAQSVDVFGGHHYLEDDGQDTSIFEVVSAPIPMTGNTVKMVANVYNSSAAVHFDLEGSVLGQFWETISDTAINTAWGAKTSADITVSHALVRVRAHMSATGKAWFEVGLAFTDQP